MIPRCGQAIMMFWNSSSFAGRRGVCLTCGVRARALQESELRRAIWGTWNTMRYEC